MQGKWFVLAAAAAMAAPGLQAQSGWKAGAAKVKITPNEPIWMAGYASRKKPSEGIRKDLYVAALALEDETGNKFALVTFDLSGVKREWTETIADQCRDRFGIARDRIVFNASHTHSGPVTTPLPYYSLVDAQQAAVIQRYTQELVKQATAAVGQAIANLSPATLEFGQGFAGIVVNRRRVAHREFPGPVDQDVPVLAVRAPGGQLRAVVVGYACHATSLGDYQISGDWPGYAKEEIEKAHPGTVALFVQGCGADANPLPRYQGNDPALLPYSVALPQMYGKILAAAVDLVLQARMKPLSGPLRTAFDRVDLPIRIPDKDQLEQQANSRNEAQQHAARLLLEKIKREGKLPDRYPDPVQVWQFGRGLKFIAMGGEVVVDYALRLKRQYGFDNTWVAGYSNDVFGYVPSLRVLKEGGYEGGDANRSLGGPFGAGVEEMIVEKVGDLVERTAPGDFRLGIVGTDTSHVPALTRLFNDPSAPGHVNGFRVVAAYKGGSPDLEISSGRVEKFAAEIQSKWGVEIVPDIATLCRKVDGVLIESVDGRPHLEQAKQVIAARKPMFLDKPFAATLEDAREIARAAREARVPWFSTSDERYNPIVTTFQGPGIQGADVWGPGPLQPQQAYPLELSWYGIHAIEMLYALMGTGCDEVSWTYTPDADLLAGRWKDGRLGTVHTIRPYGAIGAVVYRGRQVLQSDPGMKPGYSGLANVMARFFETGVPPFPNRETLEVFAFMDAAQRSKAAGGRPVKLR